VLVGEDDDLHPIAEVEFAQDRPDVGLDRRLADEDRRRDLGVGQPAGDTGEDLALTLGQLGVCRGRGAASPEVALQKAAEVGGREYGVAEMDGADGFAQDVGCGVLEEENRWRRSGLPLLPGRRG
jgi:hypothetical protein